MKFNPFLLSISFSAVLSCSVLQIKKQEILDTNTGIMTEFEEVNHVNIKLIDSDYQFLNSQEDINMVYSLINKKNPSPRKTPIPSYSESETYIVLQPDTQRSDFEVMEIFADKDVLKVKVRAYDNPELADKKHPASIVKINKKDIVNRLLSEKKKIKYFIL